MNQHEQSKPVNKVPWIILVALAAVVLIVAKTMSDNHNEHRDRGPTLIEPIALLRAVPDEEATL